MSNYRALQDTTEESDIVRLNVVDSIEDERDEEVNQWMEVEEMTNQVE